MKIVMRNVVALMMFCLGACVPATPEPTATPQPTPTPETVEFSFDDITIELQQPSGWDVYVKTENRLIMAEGDDPFRASGGLKGLLINIWVPSLSQINVDYDLEEHSIAQVLNLVLRTSDVDKSAVVHDPISFEWAGRDAAYYTLTHPNGNLSLVLALKVADNHFIAVNISAPHGHGERIRDILPTVFDPFHINGSALGNDALLGLPSPLLFPIVSPISPTE